jgi:hypothetical protein
MVYEAFDTNGDGVADSWATDLNGDGLYDQTITDPDANGLIDTYSYDYNNNGIAEVIIVDSNEDGIAEAVFVDMNENNVLDGLENSSAGTTGPMMSPVVWQTGTSGMVFGPGAEIVMDANSHAINTTLTPDGYEYVPKDDY